MPRNGRYYMSAAVNLSNSAEELTALARKARLPVTTTLLIGRIPETIRWRCWASWMRGNLAVQECDLLVSVGARFDDRVTEMWRNCAACKVAHIDIDPSAISRA